MTRQAQHPKTSKSPIHTLPMLTIQNHSTPHQHPFNTHLTRVWTSPFIKNLPIENEDEPSKTVKEWCDRIGKTYPGGHRALPDNHGTLPGRSSRPTRQSWNPTLAVMEPYLTIMETYLGDHGDLPGNHGDLP